MRKGRQANFLNTRNNESNKYVPEIIVAALLGIVVFVIIMIIIH